MSVGGNGSNDSLDIIRGEVEHGIGIGGGQNQDEKSDGSGNWRIGVANSGWGETSSRAEIQVPTVGK